MEKPEGFITCMIASDFHIPFHLVNAVDLWIEAIRDMQPDVVIINGDFLDCYSLSSFTKKPGMPSFQEELDMGVEILERVVEAAPRARRVFLEGNHEERLMRTMLSNPGLYGLRSLSYRHLLSLDRLGFEHLEYPHVLQIHKLAVKHGDGRGSSHAGRAVQGDLMNREFDHLVIGHVHKLGLYHRNGHERRKSGMELGGLFDIAQCDYRLYPNWSNGFGIAYVQPEEVILQPVEVLPSGAFVLNGRLYAK